jgi:hypothetical protein
MNCPNCKKKQYCGCPSCKKENVGRVTRTSHGNSAQCGHCGYEMSSDGWLDEEWRQIQETRANQNCTVGKGPSQD